MIVHGIVREKSMRPYVTGGRAAGRASGMPSTGTSAGKGSGTPSTGWSAAKSIKALRGLLGLFGSFLAFLPLDAVLDFFVACHHRRRRRGRRSANAQLRLLEPAVWPLSPFRAPSSSWAHAYASSPLPQAHCTSWQACARAHWSEPWWLSSLWLRKVKGFKFRL